MDKTIAVECEKIEDTQALGRSIGKALRGGEVIEFKSDLGGGKTTFVKGLAGGLGVKEVVQSPTFTISFIYQAERDLELHHFDFYRLQDAGIMNAELAESLQQPNAIVAIEWGDIVHSILPKDLISVTLSVKQGETREIKFEVPAKFDYLQKVIQDFKNDSNS